MSVKVWLIKRHIPGMDKDNYCTQYYCGDDNKGNAIWGFAEVLVSRSIKEMTDTRGRHGGNVVEATLFLPE